MKAILLVAVLCLLSTSAFSIGRPHNVFATHKAVTERVANQPKKNVLPQPSMLKNVTEQAQNGVEETRQAASMIGKFVGLFLKINQ
jgi:hypothetical protein